jgi:RNA polymerase sigma-70 factor (ECF subfamily)
MRAAELDANDMLATAEGDREALARLYDRHAPLLLSLAQRIVGRDAEDLVHDLFVEVWRQAGDYDPHRGSVATWLRLKTRSRALDRLRATQRARAAALDDASPESAADGAGAIGPSMELAADRHALERALGELPAEQRDVLLLGYFEGLSAAEIALRIGIPAGTVKSRAAAALAKLRLQLRGSGDAHDRP